MIEDTVRYLKEQGKEVVYDAEHFYDGYLDNPDYALSTLEAAEKVGMVSSLRNQWRQTRQTLHRNHLDRGRKFGRNRRSLSQCSVLIALSLTGVKPEL